MSMSNTEKTVKEIRRNTRRKFSTEEKIRIVLDGLRGEFTEHCATVFRVILANIWPNRRKSLIMAERTSAEYALFSIG